MKIKFLLFAFFILFNCSLRAQTPYIKQIYGDLDKLARDEQHRFELLISHWDVMTEKIVLGNQ